MNIVVAAGWTKRFIAWVIDMHISMLALVLAYLGSQVAYGTLPGTIALWTSVALYVLWYAVGFYNRCILMGRRGHSFGRHVVGTNLVFEKSGKPIGILNAFIRENCHFLDWFSLGYGWMMPLWDGRRQTVADKVVHTVTVEGPVPNRPVVLVSAARADAAVATA